MKNQKVGLSDKELMAVAPSIFATKAWEGVSNRYAFIPSIAPINALRDVGMVPVRAAQSKCRVAGKREFTKHMVRFRSKADALKYPGTPGVHDFFKKGSEPHIVEVILTNAHDRSAAYGLDAGIFRLLCSNGLIISSANFGSIHIYHSGNVVDAVLKGTKEIIDRAPLIQQQVESWRKLNLTDAQRLLLAEAILINRYGVDKHNNHLAPVSAESLLIPRRPEDEGKTLWVTTNVIQENIMRGDVIGVSRTGRRVRTRTITSVNAELDINRNVWATAGVLAERLAA